jgi:ABC-type nitrate/sulfonate/bicarbonate transport system substrate-binding protein
MRRLIYASIFLLVSGFLLQPSAQAVDKIRIGLPADAGHFTFPLAQKRGFLREEGFEAEIITITGPVANIALTNGDIDYYTGFGSAMRSMLQGLLPSRVVVCYRPSPHFVMLSRPELKSVKDLQGKTIGVAFIGGGPDLVARMMLRHFGLDPQKDVKFVAGGGTEVRVFRMKQGLLDATAVPVPWDYHGKKMGFNIVARAEDLFTYPISGLVAHTRKIKEKPDEIKRLIRAGIKANRYMRANREGTIPILMSTYKIDKEVASAIYDSFVKGFNDDGSLPEDGFRRLIEDTKSITKVDREVALSEVADLSILREAQRELGIATR